MTHRRMRNLMIASATILLVSAGWIALNHISEQTNPLDSTPPPTGMSSRVVNPENGMTDSLSRSLGDLNEILRHAKDDWQNLKDSRYFFEDYADEIVIQFTLEEIRRLALERGGHDFSSVIGFHYAIMRRWGEIESMIAPQFLDKINYYRRGDEHDLYRSLSEKERKHWRRRYQVESGSGATSDFLFRYHEKLLEEFFIGHIRSNPTRFVATLIESNKTHKEKGSLRDTSHILDRQTLLEAFKSLTEQNPIKAHTLLGDKEKLALLSPISGRFVSDPPAEGINIKPLVEGYFLGLPDQSNWLKIYESLDTKFQEESLVPMLARWMNDDSDSASGWIRRQKIPADFFKDNPDPFAAEQFKWLDSVKVNQNALLLGHATGKWFRRNSKEASHWISQNLQDLSPEFFEISLKEMVHTDSPTGFLAILQNLGEVENLQTRGLGLLKFQKNMNFFTSMFPHHYQWRHEERILNFLNEVELLDAHRRDLDGVIKEAERQVAFQMKRE